jgi:hypothetical protein
MAIPRRGLLAWNCFRLARDSATTIRHGLSSEKPHGKWVSTTVPCKPLSKSWNPVTIKVQRTSSDQLLYQSITLNGVTTTLSKTYSPFSAPGWWGVVVNFQLDGNYKQSPYSVYLDKFSFTYY